MCTHTTGPRTQAYVCVCILMPRNPNFDFPISFALFVLPNMPLFQPPYILLSFFFFVHMFICHCMLD